MVGTAAVAVDFPPIEEVDTRWSKPLSTGISGRMIRRRQYRVTCHNDDFCWVPIRAGSVSRNKVTSLVNQ